MTPLITDVANGKPASVLHMLSSHVCIAVDANSSYLSNHAQSMRRRAETQILCTGSAGRQCKVQVVAALVIRDAVGDAISRQQAAVKPGPWPGRRAAGEALSRASSVLGGHVHGRTFTCPHLGSVYLYLRRSETGLPLPEPSLRPPTATPALPLKPYLRPRPLREPNARWSVCVFVWLCGWVW